MMSKRTAPYVMLVAGLTVAACAQSNDSSVEEQTASVSTGESSDAAGAAMTEVAPQTRPPSGIEFKSVLALNQVPGPGEPQLRGGRVANSKEWQASLYATFETPRGTAACTAALVGPQAVLTAAHCVPEDGIISFRFPGSAQPYKADCRISSRYATDDSADFALCKVRSVVATPAGFKFERINTSPMDQIAGKRLVLTGFGCISDVAAEDDTDGLYRVGYNVVDETSNSQTRRRGAAYYAPTEVNNLLTRDDPDLANLCPGDSGGPAFVAEQSGSEAHGKRSIVGVNSRVFYRDATRKVYGSSLVSATGGADFEALFDSFNGDLAVCGLGGGLQNCRQ